MAINIYDCIVKTIHHSLTTDLIDYTVNCEDKLATNISNAQWACESIKTAIFRARVSTDASIPRANYLIIESDFGGAVEILIDDLPCVYTVDGFKLMIFKELFGVALKEKIEDEF
jgi:hypothetical protein